ncbi:unnamed protein product [Eruca vesicaria subsp. sativa]|uniref:Uncharacterized protein n=1 Tax=Eruca vesicaria subsp. sativa TaxID=29727 RepID=A0ABC8L2P5_ERUVS|nr:unnamed protein product [Eruca vesicaria subsp. sativa]
MEKSSFFLVVISFGLLFACVIEATGIDFQDETSHVLWPRKLLRGQAYPPPRGSDKAAMVGVKPWSPSQRLVFRMLPKNVPIPPSGPSGPPSPPRTV